MEQETGKHVEVMVYTLPAEQEEWRKNGLFPEWKNHE
jgi:hypothetical protein